MQYIYVSGCGNVRNEFTVKLYKAAGTSTAKLLYSVVEGLKQKDFGINTMTKCGFNIRVAKEKFCVDSEPYIDSGGYSILTGDVTFDKIPNAIDSYTYYLANEFDTYKRIFSLDIPFCGLDSDYNTYQNVENANRASLEKSRNVIAENNSIADKFMFVWQFMLEAQYRIFGNLYEELELSRWVGGHAIGGLVGLRGRTKIRFSAFIGMAYRCLADYMSAQRFDIPFRLHLLGIYLRQDRFVIAILEALFKNQLENAIDVELTYDSVNYEHSSRMNTELPIFNYDGQELLVFENVQLVPEELIAETYKDEELCKFILEEIKLRKDGHRLKNASSFGPINIKSNIDLDKLIMDIVERYEIAEIFKYSSFTVIDYKFRLILEDLQKKYPLLFSKNFCTDVMNSVSFIYHFNWWFKNSRKGGDFDHYIKQMINKINSPRLIQ